MRDPQVEIEQKKREEDKKETTAAPVPAAAPTSDKSPRARSGRRPRPSGASLDA
jgi:hypothetical protein